MDHSAFFYWKLKEHKRVLKFASLSCEIFLDQGLYVLFCSLGSAALYATRWYMSESEQSYVLKLAVLLHQSVYRPQCSD